MDRYGLPIESQGDFDPAQSGIISSLMRNVAQLSQTVNKINRYANLKDRIGLQ